MKQDGLSPIGPVHETERVYLKSSVCLEWLADIGRPATTIEPRAVRKVFFRKGGYLVVYEGLHGSARTSNSDAGAYVECV